MSFDITSWTALQWTFYAIFVGLLSGMLGNLWATAYIQHQEVQAKLKNEPIDWKSRYYQSSILIIIVGIILLGLVYFT